MQTPIHHIADTAFWIAAFRAQETARPDAVLHDLLAAKLAGEKGVEMVKATPRSHLMAFAMVIRTLGIDKLVEDAVAQGVDTVINLGAGLDTRPYRMKLPQTLNWIEVDYQQLIDYKNEKLAGDQPVCKLQRLAADLSSETERNVLFDRLAAQTKMALIITEGVIGYLGNEEAAVLARHLHVVPVFKYWAQDFGRGRFRKHRNANRLKKILENIPIKFNHPEPLVFFGKLGWRIAEVIHVLDQADAVNRRLPGMFPWNLLARLFPRLIRRLANKTYGYVMLERAEFAAVSEK